MEPLQVEIKQIIGSGPVEEMNVGALSKLVKLDSFIKESQRHTHGNIREHSSIKGSSSGMILIT